MKQRELFVDPEIEKTKEALRSVRHEHFKAKTAPDKQRLRKQDEKLREQLVKLLSKSNAFAPEDAKQMAAWNPYDQNAVSPFFDPEWMFGITDGFDIVIGNPPYVSVRTKYFDVSKKQIYKNTYSLAVGQYDLYTLFIELSEHMLNEQGILSFIIPTRMLSNENFMAARKFVIKYLPIKTYLYPVISATWATVYFPDRTL